MLNKKLIRRLTGSYAVNPQPEDWLVAADHFEEVGWMASANLWRYRGLWYPLLRACYEKIRPTATDLSMEWRHPIGSSATVEVGPYYVYMERRPRTITVRAQVCGQAALIAGDVVGDWIMLRGWHLDAVRRRINRRIIYFVDRLSWHGRIASDG